MTTEHIPLYDKSRDKQHRMAELIKALAPNEGYTLTAIDGVKLMRSDRDIARTPVLYEPSIVVVVSGKKRGFIGDSVYNYDAQQFLVLSVPLPFESETIATPEDPMLAVQIPLDLTVIAELLVTLDAAAALRGESAVGICSTRLDDKLTDAVLRLVEALGSPLESRALGAAILREIYFRALTSEQGPAIRAALNHQSYHAKINRALRRIHADYAGDLDVDTLADEAGMSVAAFHASFKAVTGTSPIQYLKTVRLHKARLLMVQDGINASTAAVRVGYESASQFSREFKRFFGRPPLEEALAMKNALLVSSHSTVSAYVTVQ